MGFNFILASLSGIEPEKILRDFGLAGVELSGLVAIIFFLVNSFYRDRQTKMLELFLSRSTREEFFLGKFLGYGLTIIFFIIISASSLCLVLFFKQALNSAILPAVWFTFLKLLIIISVVFLFSLLLSSPLLAAALGLGVYLCGSTSKAALEIIRMQTPPSQFQITAMKIYQFILPQLDKLEIKLAASYGRLPELSYLFQPTSTPLVISLRLC